MSTSIEQLVAAAADGLGPLVERRDNMGVRAFAGRLDPGTESSPTAVLRALARDGEEMAEAETLEQTLHHLAALAARLWPRMKAVAPQLVGLAAWWAVAHASAAEPADGTPSPVLVEPLVWKAAVALAAAMAVLGLVWWVKRGPGPIRTDFRPSTDYKAVEGLRHERSDLDGAAELLLADPTEPWMWSLAGALRSRSSAIEADSLRNLLAALAEKCPDIVVPLEVSEGQLFDPARMQDLSEVIPPERSAWEVAEVRALGFRVGSEIAVRSDVICCTTDWRTLRGTFDSEVGRFVANHCEEFISDDEADRRAWRASDGLIESSVLRETFGEPDVQNWLRHVHEAFKRELGPDDPGLPILTGSAGVPFEAAKMRCESGAVHGQPAVSAVVKRDGVLQRGLATSEGIALVEAVVEVTWEDGA